MHLTAFQIYLGGLHFREIAAFEPRVVKACSHQPRPSQQRTAEVGSRQVGLGKIRLGKVGPEQLGFVEISSRKVGPPQAGPAQIGSGQISVAQVGLCEIGPGKPGAPEIGIREVDPLGQDTHQISVGKIAFRQQRLGDVGTAQISSSKRRRLGLQPLQGSSGPIHSFERTFRLLEQLQSRPLLGIHNHLSITILQTHIVTLSQFIRIGLQKRLLTKTEVL